MNSGHKIYYHKIGTPQSQDVLFYQNPTQPMRFYYADVNEEETMMYLFEAGAGAGNNLFVRDLRQKDSQFIQLTDNMDYQYTPVYNEGTYNRRLHNRTVRESALDDIPGIGPAKKMRLLKTFGSVYRLARADRAELAAQPGIGPELADAILRAVGAENGVGAS